jgi:hypothetical protein
MNLPMIFRLRYGIMFVAIATLATTATADTNCNTLLSSGSGATLLRVCISSDGNVSAFQSPSGVEYLGTGTVVEGYQLCTSDGEAAYDAGFTELNWGVPTIVEPNGPNTLPLTIFRNTADGRFQLKQQYSISVPTKTVTLTMTITNLGATFAPNVTVVRFGDIDPNGSDSNVFVRTNDTVLGEQSATLSGGVIIGTGNALSLTAQSNTIAHTAFIESFSDFTGFLSTHNGCAFANRLAPTAGQTGAPGPGDYVGGIAFFSFGIKAGGKEVITVNYRRL